ncbi:MAG: 3-oxoacyl-[acyl-carrier-protein] reductase [Acidobacteriota bacterium]|nr:3-oxoacyl-[acyl-carrier-protein] reductase [Acidobacteriota bacterium]
MKRFEGRRALVTGASRGIGEAVAKRLAEEGAVVLAAARTAADLERVVGEIRSSGGQASALPLDLSDSASIDAAAKTALADGVVDVLVNNAGVTDDNLLLRMSRESWDRVISTNLTGVFLLTQAVIRSMIKKRYGRIVNVTSVVGIMGNPGQANYAASKAGLIGFTKSVARELASRNVTCNAVAPGFIATSMTEKMTDDAKTALSSQIPLGRLGSPGDVASAVAYLASEDAAYVTGHVLNVSGGLLI